MRIVSKDSPKGFMTVTSITKTANDRVILLLDGDREVDLHGYTQVPILP